MFVLNGIGKLLCARVVLKQLSETTWWIQFKEAWVKATGQDSNIGVLSSVVGQAFKDISFGAVVCGRCGEGEEWRISEVDLQFDLKDDSNSLLFKMQFLCPAWLKLGSAATQGIQLMKICLGRGLEIWYQRNWWGGVWQNWKRPRVKGSRERVGMATRAKRNGKICKRAVIEQLNE